MVELILMRFGAIATIFIGQARGLCRMEASGGSPQG
jgi:hypothetical protein